MPRSSHCDCRAGAELRAEGDRREDPAVAEPQCVDPSWAPPAFIGTSWSLVEISRDGAFLSGRLANPRGGIQAGRVFVLASEWDCG